MACCIIAAYLWAMAVERLRRIGMFWGLVQPRLGEVPDTAYARLAARLRRKVTSSAPVVDGARSRIAG